MSNIKHDDYCPCTRFRAQAEFCSCGAVERDEIVKDVAARFAARLCDIEARAALSDEAQPFWPGIIENPTAGLAEMVLEDCATITGPAMEVRPLYRMTDRAIIGFQWDIPYAPLPSDEGGK